MGAEWSTYTTAVTELWTLGLRLGLYSGLCGRLLSLCGELLFLGIL